MSNATYARLKRAYPNEKHFTFKDAKARAQALGGYKTVPYDMCVNSCCLFAGPYEDAATCPYCKEPRLNADGKPRHRFSYIPIIPRLQAYYRRVETIEQMKYRGDFVPDPNTMHDVFDGTHYRDLRKERVKIDDAEYRHKFFQDGRDVALGLSSDGASISAMTGAGRR